MAFLPSKEDHVTGIPVMACSNFSKLSLNFKLTVRSARESLNVTGLTLRSLGLTVCVKRVVISVTGEVEGALSRTCVAGSRRPSPAADTVGEAAGEAVGRPLSGHRHAAASADEVNP